MRDGISFRTPVQAFVNTAAKRPPLLHPLVPFIPAQSFCHLNCLTRSLLPARLHTHPFTYASTQSHQQQRGRLMASPIHAKDIHIPFASYHILRSYQPHLTTYVH